MSPNEFFNHPILNIVLYNNLGATEYEYLKKQYQKVKIDTKEFTDITKKLDDVMDSGVNIPTLDVIERSINDIEVSDRVENVEG